MISLEQEVRDYLTAGNFGFTDETGSPDMPDFVILMPDQNQFFLEVKEKRQPAKLSNWPHIDFPEADMFMVDELTCRRLMNFYPYAGILLRDNVSRRYAFFNIMTLMLMPRVRVNRQITDNGAMKGKWMVNIRNGVVTKTISTAITAVSNYSERAVRSANLGQCVGRYVGEEIPVGGEVRAPWMKEYDYGATR